MSEDPQFLLRARREVLEHLEAAGIPFSTVPPQPLWALAPHLAVWPVYGKSPFRPGWYAISGDVPADHVSSAQAPDARSALRHFARAWERSAEHMARGAHPPGGAFAVPEAWPALEPLLRTRARLLAELADDDGQWDGP